MSRRLASVSLANWRSNDPRSRRRFVTAFGDALREHGGVAIEGATTGPEALRELLEALAAYFGLGPTAFCDRIEPGDVAGLEVARLSHSTSGGQITLADSVARGPAAVFTAGPALEAWTSGIVRAREPQITDTAAIDRVSTTADAAVMDEFREAGRCP